MNRETGSTGVTTMDLPTIPAERRISPVRVLAVATGLVAGGAVAGAAAGAIGVALWAAVTVGLREALDPGLWFLAAMVGAPFGAVLLPLAGFTALRRVPLGRLLATTVAATALGGAIGAAINSNAWLVGAIAGFLAATGWLWFRSRRPAAGSTVR